MSKRSQTTKASVRRPNESSGGHSRRIQAELTQALHDWLEGIFGKHAAEQEASLDWARLELGVSHRGLELTLNGKQAGPQAHSRLRTELERRGFPPH